MKHNLRTLALGAASGLLALIGSAAHAQTASDLFISEYVEGSSNNKYIEIYNGTGAPVNLADYQLRNYANGAVAPSFTNTLTGTLANGSAIVYKNSSATIYGGTATNLTSVVFNGDDAIVLWKVSTNAAVDIFGRIGDDPGTSWTGTDGVTSFTTVDKTLRRKCGITGGVSVNPAGTGPGAFTTLSTEWEQFNTDEVSGLGSHTACYAPAFCTTDLLISEYVEGSSNNKCIEIFNGTGVPVDLAAGGYRLKVYFNGSLVPATNIALSGIIAHNDVYVICNPLATAPFLAVADATNGGVQFNGDDAVVLEKNAGIVVDLFGRIGEDPGVSWSSGLNGTLDQTLRRNTTVVAGITANPAAGFPTLGTEWTTLGLNFSADLGAHTVTCGSVTPPTVALGNDVTVCSGTTVTLDGGAAATSWNWSTGETSRFITVSNSGVYSVTATNSGGSASDAIAVNYSATPVLSIAPASAIVCAGGSQTLTATALATGLYISEYVEGSGNNKALEIFNGTGASIDLGAGGYNLQVSFNGGTSVITIALTGSVAAGATYVVADELAVAGILSAAQQTVSGGLWNGDDAISLRQGTVVLDVFGVVGNDPGAQWWSGPGTTGIRTSDRTLLRNCNVWGGVTANSTGTGVNAFNSLGSEWSELATDDISNLGIHASCPAFSWSNTATGPAITVSLSVSENYSVTVSNVNACAASTAAAVTISNPLVAATGETTVCPGTPAQVCAAVQSRDLLISEYVEGSGFTKYIEIYNGTGAAVNLAGYELRAYHNGAAAPTFINDLSVAGTLAPGATLVAANPQAITYPGAVQVYFGVNHNGDDAIALFNTNTGAFVDIFGRIGEDPGSAWVSGANQTADATLRRNSNVVAGVTLNPISGFPTLASEWSHAPINDVSGLGTHSLSASGTFSWSDGQPGACVTVAPTATTTFTVTYTDAAGCTATDDVTVNTFAQPAVNAGADGVVYPGYAPAACTTLHATASAGTAPYSFNWSTGATSSSLNVCPASTTTFTVTVTDANGCTATDAVTVCAVNVTCGNNKVLVCHVPPGNPAAANTLCIAAPAVASHLAHGDHLGTCGASTPCDGNNKTGEAASAEALITSIEAFPNPFATTTSLRIISASGGQTTVEVFNVAGVMIATLFEGTLEAGATLNLELDGSSLAEGVYFVRFSTAEGRFMHKLALVK